jgi:type IV pilus assembly protein PilQ
MNKTIILGVCLAILVSGNILAEEEAKATEPAQVAAVEPVMPAVVVVTPAAAAPSEPVAPAAAPAVEAAEPVVIEYIEADIQNVLRTLAAKAGTNLILGDEVTGKVTLHLENVSYDDAMRLVIESKGYAYVKEKNVLKVKSRQSLELEPVEVKIHTLNYAKADDVRKTLEPVLTKQGKIQVDARSNTLVLSDTPSSLAKIVPLIESLDAQTPQVLIEAKFVETTKNPTKDLGINWNKSLQNRVMGLRRPSPDKAIDSSGGANPSPLEFAKNLGTGAWTWPTAILDAGEAQMVFSFMANDTDTELLANPQIVTTDNGKARISIAEQFPIPSFSFSEQTASLNISGFEYKDIGIILNVTPRINKNEFVTLEVNPEVSISRRNATISTGNNNVINIPIINTRVAMTTVLIKSGHTLAIGGLVDERSDDSYSKVPVMGDLPLLGPLFRSKSLSKSKQNLLIFLTPKIVSPESQTGYEKYVNGFPDEEVYSKDKWMPRDNAKARSILGIGAKSGASKPSQNFNPR